MALLIAFLLSVFDCPYCTTHNYNKEDVSRFTEVKTDTGVYYVGEWSFGSFNSLSYDSVRNVWYIGAGQGVLIIGDVSVNCNIISDDIRANTWVHDIEYRISDSVLFVATPYMGVQVWDVKDIYNPVIISDFSSSGVDRIQLIGDYLYAAKDNTLFILNVANLDSINIVGIYNAPFHINNFKVMGDYAYLSCGDSGVIIVNVSNPDSPQTESRYSFSGNAVDVDVQGNYMYVADATNGLRIVDAQDPSNPVEVGFYQGNAQGVAVSGNYVYFPETGDIISDTLIVLDVSDPSNPVLAGQYYGYELYFVSIRDMSIMDSHLYLCTAASIMVFDVSDASNIYLQSDVSSPASAMDLGMQDNSMLYYVSSSGAFISIDVSDPAYPTARKLVNLNQDGYRMAINGSYAYVISSCTNMAIVDISNNVSPTLITSWVVPGGAPFGPSCYVYDLAVKDNYVFLAKDDGRTYNPNGILSVDVGNPYHPSVVDSYEPDANSISRSVEVHGNYAYLAENNDYLADHNWLSVFDIQNPSSIEFVGYLEIQWRVEDMEANGNYLYIAAGDSGLLVFDISDPAFPVEVSRCNVGNASSIMSTDTFLYVATSNSVEIISITNPWEPRIITSIHPGGPVHNVWVSDPYIYIANSYNGLVIYRSTLVSVKEHRDKEISGFAFSVSPIGKNVWIRYSISDITHPIFRIYDKSGRVVKIIDEGIKSPGTYSVSVNGLKSGIYFVGFNNNGRVSLKKFVIVK